MADQLAASQAFLAEFWSGQDTSPEAIAAHVCPPSGGLPPQTWPERVQAYLEGALDLSDAELRRCTEGSDLLFHLAVVFREAGMLTAPACPAEDLEYFAEREAAHQRGRQAIADFEEENRERLAALGIVPAIRPQMPSAPSPGWNFGSGSSGVIE